MASTVSEKTLPVNQESADLEDLPLIFEIDEPERGGEYLRQAMGLISRLGVSPAPLYYALLYNHVAGRSERMSRELGELLEESKLDQEHGILLYKRFLSTDNDTLVEDIRKELAAMVAQVIGALVDVAGKTALANDKIAEHIEELASTNKPDRIVAEATAILGLTRAFVTDSRNLETGLSSSVEEMEKLKQELSNARREAAKDSLTGLYNRRAFDARMAELVKRSEDENEDFCLLLLDIDNFKRVNDNYGHLVGDKVLSEFARRIGRVTRGSDFLARYGGEEFAALLPSTRLGQGYTVAENIRCTLEKLQMRRSSSGEMIEQVTVSIGVAAHRRLERAEDLLHRCDETLYRAKRQGRNRTLVAD